MTIRPYHEWYLDENLVHCRHCGLQVHTAAEMSAADRDIVCIWGGDPTDAEHKTVRWIRITTDVPAIGQDSAMEVGNDH